MDLLIPSKTFLLGEYAVLLESKALGLATRPYFKRIKLEAIFNLEEKFHPNSPAGLYLTSKKLNQINFQLEDPFIGLGIKGGFGKSTAEFFAARLVELKDNSKLQSFSKILSDYKELFKNLDVKPSGMDLAIQYFGGVTSIDQKQNHFKEVQWPFPDLNFAIIPTGQKLATHEHLKNLQLKKIEILVPLVDRLISYFESKNELEFLEGVNIWQKKLEELQLTCETSLEMIRNLNKIRGIKAAKACGALGADVLIVFFSDHDWTSIKFELEKLKLFPLATKEHLAKGVFQQLQDWSELNVD